jgi:bifunctional oligoribonuclease and PAP phosphatase NrnA
MKIPAEIAKKILSRITSAKSICIISHHDPDADTLGSNLALRLAFENKDRRIISASVDETQYAFDFLKSKPAVIREFKPEDFDLFITVDSSSPAQTAFQSVYPEIFKKRDLINIDHHATNALYGGINLVVEEASSTSLVVFNLLKIWNKKIDADIATCILLGIYGDTGSFMHSNTSSEDFDAAAELTSLGANRRIIVEKLYKRKSLGKLRLLGKILSEAQMTQKNIIVSAIKEEDFSETETTQADLNGIIDYINMAKDNRIAALLSEDGNGNVRGSLRTKSDDLNLSEIAVDLGGGGHKKASGFTIKGKLKKTVHWSID